MATFDFQMESHKDEVEDELEKFINRVLTMWGMQAESFAKRLAPVDTGLLRNSITWAIEGREANISTYADKDRKQTGEYDGQAPNEHGEHPRSVYIGTNVEYAKYQELGSYKHLVGQSPFLKPAIDNNRDYFKRIYEEELKTLL